MKAARLTAAALLLLLLSSCAVHDRVVLLPQADGSPSGVEVTARESGRQVVLDQPYQQASVSTGGRTEVAALPADEVRQHYGALLAMKPAEPAHYALYFELGGTRLTERSEAALDAILREATQRQGGEIIVTGHTDAVGTDEVNDALSLERARYVRGLLVARGFPAGLVEAIGRGKREPKVPTADNVEAPENRRVEILVR